MPFITFIYKVGKSKKTYYGKYCSDYISDDHEGLDTEVKYSLLKGLKKYKEQHNEEKNEKSKKEMKVIVGVYLFHRTNIFPHIHPRTK